MNFAFSPKGGCEPLLIAAIASAKFALDLAIFEFTNPALAAALREAAARKVNVRIVFDRICLDTKATPSMYQVLQTFVACRVDSKHALMHNKYLIVDSRIVWTSSYNWTEHAEHANAENLVRIGVKKVVAAFKADFERHWGHST